jgi:hypothetical protein
MRGVRLKGWQRTGIMLSVLWVSCISMWFIQQVPAHQPAIASVYRQCIQEPNAHRSACKARAKSFDKEVRSELTALPLPLDQAEWPGIALAPIFLVWILAYIVVWLARWIDRGSERTLSSPAAWPHSVSGKSLF